jgi:hypothetical protein
MSDLDYLPDGRPGFCTRPVPMDQVYWPMMAHETAIYIPPATPLQRLGDACYHLDVAIRDRKRAFWRGWRGCAQQVQDLPRSARSRVALWRYRAVLAFLAFLMTFQQ